MKQKNRLESNKNLLENIFPAQWKTEFQSYFPKKLLESASNKNNYIKSFLNGYDIKIQKGNVPAVGINKTLFILFRLFYLATI